MALSDMYPGIRPNTPYTDRWRSFLDDMRRYGVNVDPGQSDGYNPRNIRGTSIPSLHASDRAVDVNWNANPEGQTNRNTPLAYDMYGEDARQPSTTIHPDIARDLARRHGLRWGGDFRTRSPDPMHFEVAGPAPGGMAGRSLIAHAGMTPPAAVQPQAAPPVQPVQPAQPAPPAPPAPPAQTEQTEQPGGQRMAGLLDWLIPQAEAGTPGSFAPQQRGEPFGPPRWLYSPPMESIAPPSINPRTGAPIPSMLPPGRSRALGGAGAAPAAAAAAPLGVPGPMMPGGGIGSDFAASPPQPPQVPPFDEGTTSLDPETTMRLAQAEHGRQNPAAPAPRRPGLGESIENWMTSPLFQMAVAFATQRDPSVAVAQAGQYRRQQSEYERQRQQRTTMDRIWGEAFPNGQPNMQHPLLTGQTPQVAQMIAGMGAETALPLLVKSAMERRQLEFKTAGDQAFVFDPRTGQSMPVPGASPKPPEAIRTTALKVNASYNSLTTALDDYQRLVQREGITALPGQARDAVTQARTNIQLQLKELYNLGVLNGPDLSLMEQLLTDTSPSPGNILSNPAGRVGPSIQRLKTMLKTLRDNAVAAAGGQAPAAAAQQPATNDPLGIR